jgi:uncharacterized protein (TIGR03067 family)
MAKTLATLVVAFSIVVAANAEDTKAKAAFDPAKIVGVFQITEGTRQGDKIDKEKLKAKITVTKNTFTVPTEDPNQKFLIEYKIDTKPTPAAIDMEIKDGPVKDIKAIGIVGADGDGFKLCYVVQEGPDSKRPAKFESTKENNAFLFVLKPEKK